MNSCKVIQSQEKSMRGVWSYNQVGGRHVKFVGTKKHSDGGEELNTLLALAVSKAMKIIKKSKAKDTSDS